MASYHRDRGRDALFLRAAAARSAARVDMAQIGRPVRKTGQPADGFPERQGVGAALALGGCARWQLGLGESGKESDTFIQTNRGQ